MSEKKSRTGMRVSLGAVLLLTLGAAWYAPEGETSEAAVSAAAAPRSALQRKASAPLDVLAIRARGEDGDGVASGLFAPAAWTASAAPAENPAAAAPAPVAEAAPALPPLPFRVMGSHEQAGKTLIFLQQNEATHVVRVGDTIGETYKVESIDASTMTLRYLPLDQVQTLELGRTLKEK